MSVPAMPEGWREEPWLIHGARWPHPHAHQDLDRSQAGETA